MVYYEIMNEKVEGDRGTPVHGRGLSESEHVRKGKEFLHGRSFEMKKAGNPWNCQMEKERKDI